MLRLITFWLLALSTLGAAAAPAPLFARSTADLQAEARAAARQGQLLAVFLTLPDCPGCREMERSVHADPATVKAIGRQFRSVRLDIAGEAPITDARGETTTPGQLAQRLRAVATPSYAFFDGRGQVRYRYTGTLDTTGFRQLATYVARGDYEHRPFVPPTRSPSAAAPASMKLHAAPPAATLPIRPAFTLAATDGKTYRHGDFNGRVLALAVGYTQCPDVCPTTLAELKAAVEALPPALRLAVQPAFVTLDPERDSLPLLAEYAAAFRPTGGRPILGLRGDAQQTAELISQLQLVADKQPSASMGYTLDHTAGVFLFAADGRLLGLSPYGQDQSELAADLRTLATAARPAAARPLAQH